MKTQWRCFGVGKKFLDTQCTAARSSTAHSFPMGVLRYYFPPGKGIVARKPSSIPEAASIAVCEGMVVTKPGGHKEVEA